jgi:phytoene synthase
MSQQHAATQVPTTSTQAARRRDPAAVLATSSFSSGILLLPAALQGDARRLYHLLRTVDDLVDERDPEAPERVEAIERWAQGHDTETPEVRTLNALAQRYPLSREAFLTFCGGMRHDLAAARIETDADLTLYCEQAGGAVGVMLSCLLGTTHPDGEHSMALLGTAMQHTNILRDIDEDRAHGRTYIPQSTIARFGAPLPGAREQLLRHEIERADAMFEQARDASRLLVHGQRAMALSAALYREILRQIERDGYGRKEGVAKVPEWRKALIIAEHRGTPASTRSRQRRL